MKTMKGLVKNWEGILLGTSAALICMMALALPLAARAQGVPAGLAAEPTEARSSGVTTQTSVRSAAGTAGSAASQIVSGCAGGILGQAIGYPIGLAFQAGLAAIAAPNAVVSVPVSNVAETYGQTLPGGAAIGGFWQTIKDSYKKGCLDKLQENLAKVIIRTARDIVLNYIQTGNLGKPTFVTNFQVDAREIARNAARIYASQLTGINFCNYFPNTPPLDLETRLDLRVQLECSIKKPTTEVVANIKVPGLAPIEDRVLARLPQFDPLAVDLEKRRILGLKLAEAQTARNTQLIAGQGSPGIERCKRWEVIQPARYFSEGTGETCDVTFGVPAECKLQSEVRRCIEKEIATPGSYITQLAFQPTASWFRENENVKELGSAIAQILDAALGKIINDGLLKAGL